MKPLFTLFIAAFLLSFTILSDKPTVYIIGDSTVKNGSGKGSDSLFGWGTVLPEHFDTQRIALQNHAIGGRSSRTFLTDGRWEKILATLKKGDYVLIQFGHNDPAPLDDTARARGTLRGIGDSSKTIYNPIRKVEETVYTYGYYMRKYVSEAKAKGALPIVCSLVPRNSWKNGKVSLATNSYATWSEQIAKEQDVPFVDLNGMIAVEYEKLGEEAVKAQFFPKDHTHTNLAGAKLNAVQVALGIKNLANCDLKNFLN